MSAAAIPLADRRQVRELATGFFVHGFVPTETFVRKLDFDRPTLYVAVRIQVVRNELVVALGRLVGNVERDHAALAAWCARESARVPAMCRSISGPSSSCTNGWSSTSCKRHLGQQRNDALAPSAESCALSITMVSFIAGCGHLDRGLGALVLRAVHDVRPVDQLLQRRDVHAELRASDVRDQARAARIARIEELAAWPAARACRQAFFCHARKCASSSGVRNADR